MQRGQAPCGELNEKILGSSSGSETPWSGQAKFSEKSELLAGVDEVERDERRPVSEAAVSIDCGQPLPQVGLHHEPVDDDLDRVLELLVEGDLVFEQRTAGRRP